MSADTTNNKGQPSKSNLKKVGKTLFANTPIRFGEMEADNILLTKRGDIVSRLFKSYSTSKEDRDNLIKQLLSAKNPMNVSVKIADGKSINRQILEKYLMIPELSLDDGPSISQQSDDTTKKD